MTKQTVVVGMSGGVDSSVTALLLKQQGYHVIGMFMKNWEEKNADGVCQSSLEYEDVIRVCDQLDIPYYSVNFVKEYWDNVFTHFLDEFKKGYTPNPDILCNREIKFKVLLAKALEIGGDFLATGHYCQNREYKGSWELLKGSDMGKDQSYFLYTMGQHALSKVLFPIGHLQKKELREIARTHQLATCEKQDSTGICFIGERNFKSFLKQYIPYTPGNFETLSGKIIGRHDGVAYYTPGQRKGMGIGGPGEPWFVVGKDILRNVVYIEQGLRHPSLFCDELTATEVSWVKGSFSNQLPYRCKSKVRYRQPDQDCTITAIDGETLHVHFDIPQRAVTPRQSIVFYDGDVCLGGAIIQIPGQSYYTQQRMLPNIVAS
ncbi:MAG: tRNA 2-thiouridine(34) synthase MnmA [Parachlamydiaceae bacterium]|nr:tRNA 2-thiouridine(34) synthase MnmA [Parachlamydiaceae bacterium]